MFKFLKKPIYLGLLRNAINAKLTLQQSTQDEKMQVYVYANALYVSSGRITNLEAAILKVQQNVQQIDAAFGRMSEYSKTTLYALAMMEIGVEPGLVGEGWNFPTGNPMAMESEMDQTDVETVVSYFWDKHKIRVSMNLGANST